jgi:hypothetical protein
MVVHIALELGAKHQGKDLVRDQGGDGGCKQDVVVRQIFCET